MQIGIKLVHQNTAVAYGFFLTKNIR